MDPPLTIWELANIELIPLQEHLDTSTISHVGKIDIFFPRIPAGVPVYPALFWETKVKDNKFIFAFWAFFFLFDEM